MISLLVSDFQRSVSECSVHSCSCPWLRVQFVPGSSSLTYKVHVFREDHWNLKKILQFFLMLTSTIANKIGRLFFKFCDLLRIYELYIASGQIRCFNGSHCTYRTRVIITRSWFETALDYKPRILGPKKDEFYCLVHKLSVILAALP